MQNKYYTPSISEFHVEFECEINANYTTTTHFIKYIIVENDPFNIPNLLKKGDVRVKYLDKEDIESLGFVCTGDIGIESEFQKYEDNYTWIVLETSFDNEITIEREVDVNKDGYVTATYTLFKGKIKNKSELKRLLIQLGINIK
jgi:hypothetical protein